MGLDTLFYRMMVIWLSALTSGACAVTVARRWLRSGSGIGREAEGGASVWVVTVEMIANLAFIVWARTHPDYSQPVFDRLWIACLSLSASLTLAAVVVLMRSSSRTSMTFKVRMVLLIALNLLGAASLLMRY